MRRENIKTVILSVLVVISLVLTWGIWTFQPNFSEGTASTKSTVREKHKIDKTSQKVGLRGEETYREIGRAHV